MKYLGIALLVLISACNNGPEVETCVIDTTVARCHYKNGGYARNFDQLIGYVCFKPRHFAAMLEACSAGDPIAVEPCIFGPTDLQCPDKRYTFSQVINFVCVSTYSMRKIVKWCTDND